MTEKRAAILQILQESEGHLPAEEIFARARLRYPGIVLATVYNNLHALEEAGLILHIRTTDGPDFYDKTPSPHEHAFCTECGRGHIALLGYDDKCRRILGEFVHSHSRDRLHHTCAHIAEHQRHQIGLTVAGGGREPARLDYSIELLALYLSILRKAPAGLSFLTQFIKAHNRLSFSFLLLYFSTFIPIMQESLSIRT